MIVLACETSTLLGSVALIENNRVLAAAESMRQGSHSDVLNFFIDQVLRESGKTLKDVDLFATGIGPGSFTGIRICLNTIKSFAYCFNKPVVGISSLHALAAQAQVKVSETAYSGLPIVSMINAYKNMVYTATYRIENNRLLEQKKPEVIRVQNLADYIPEKSIVCGDGYTTYQSYFTEDLQQRLVRVPHLPDEPNARTLAQLALSENPLLWSQILPLYLRASEAEENMKGIKYQPLF